MSRKKLDTEKVLSELTGQSAFFKKEAKQSEPPQSNDRTEIRTEERTEMRSLQYPVKRLTRRYSFEFYDDQIIQVKAIKHDLEMTGQRATLSGVVREALDEYLNTRDPQDQTEIRSEIRTNESPNGKANAKRRT